MNVLQDNASNRWGTGDLQIYHRVCVEEWLEAVRNEYKFGSEWKNSTMRMLDTYVDNHKVSQDDVQKLACVCGHICAVCVSGENFQFTDWAKLCDNAYSTQSLYLGMKEYVMHNWKPPFNLYESSRFLRKLGHGNSDVFEAVFASDKSKRHYAVKQFKVESKFCVPLEYIRELQALTMMQGHPHASSFIGTWMGTNHTYIIYELYPNTLQQYVQDNKVDLKEAKILIHQLLDVLYFAHGRGLAHRDVKPHNILLRSTGHLILGDWDSSATLPIKGFTTNPICTLPYRAPEYLVQYDEFPNNPYQLDVWSAGCVFLYMLNGENYFKAFKEPELLNEICSQLGTEVNYMRQRTKLQRKLWPMWLSRILGEQGIAFVDGLLHLDPNLRFTILEALTHPFLNS